MEFQEVCRSWYAAQQRELEYHRQMFSFEIPSLHPASPFDPEEDADALRKAMKGLGTNESAIIDILTKRTLDQRLKIEDKYQKSHGRDLSKDLKSELTGVFEKVILSLLKPMPLFFAEQIKLATKGVGTDETALIEIFCTRDDESIKTIQEAFENQYGKPLEKIICKETGGNFEKTLMSILAYGRDDSGSSPTEVAEKLCSDDIKEDDIRKIMTSYSFNFLTKVFQNYSDSSGEDFMKLVEKKCKGDAKDSFKAIYLSAKSRSEFFAVALHEAMKGMGADDWALIRIIVSRCEIDLENIKQKYAELYGKDLISEIKKETKGDYEKALLSLLGA